MKHTPHSGALAISLALTLMLLLPTCRQGDDHAPVNKQGADTTGGAQVQREESKTVDLGRWQDMSWEDFDRLFVTFAKTDPPVVRDYGVCDSITCIFPSSDKTAKPEILICDLNQALPAAEAFKLLGIETGRVIGSDAGWVNLGALDGRYSSLKYKTTGSDAENTRQLLVQFKR